MKKYFERSLNGSPWRNSAASLLLHLYNFIKSIENAGNSVSVTAVRAGGWSSVSRGCLDTSHSSPVTQKCRQNVTDCHKMLHKYSNYMTIGMPKTETFLHFKVYMMLSEMIMTLS